MQRTVSATYYRYYLRFCINVIQSKKEFYQKSNSNQKDVIQIKIAIKKKKLYSQICYMYLHPADCY